MAYSGEKELMYFPFPLVVLLCRMYLTGILANLAHCVNVGLLQEKGIAVVVDIVLLF